MSNDGRSRMDDVTAMAFAGHEFEKRHPRSTWPSWLRRCTVASVHEDRAGRIIVSLAVTPIATNAGVCYFEVAVHAATAETEVLLDTDFNGFNGEELQGF
jgi:hypothetical protein